jgi:hypothetical protein
MGSSVKVLLKVSNDGIILSPDSDFLSIDNASTLKYPNSTSS